VRDRISQGANFGPFALEGFVVELWLANKGGPSLRAHPAITGLVAGTKLAPTADDKLAAVIGGEVEIVDGLDADAAPRWTGWNTVTVRFRDGLGRAFFEEENRPRFVGLADRVASATGATHGALFARCAHQTTHDVGAWFRGPDLPGAAAVMMYEIGFFSDTKVIDGRALTSLRGPGGEVEGLRKATGDIEDVIPKLVGTSGGSVTAGPPPTLHFALAAPSRSLSATRELARKMGIGVATGD
jgi:serine/threonine-protein kinase